ncbi:MAG TPA: serine/threonine-protein kinase, partial [Vicinamibacteria bacterium]|nr:serine/threonine-protein kinase [Vicinamibacteria bacterium]
MATPCLACTVDVPAGARFCPGCGASVDLASTPTGTAPRGEARPATPPGSRAPRGTSAARVSSVVAGDARFVPGTVLRDRYRIVGLLGKGGMGEVYRADDLKLGQAVALKFLPESLSGDPERRERFYNEVRTAREVTHPAVTRVHDIDEVDGHVFLSMEYVDGEDLGSLLRRIGRLPQDKAVEIARQVCAGLAAAHDKGVLHRDLKPENVMLDGRGRARITDFGLAGL